MLITWRLLPWYYCAVKLSASQTIKKRSHYLKSLCHYFALFENIANWSHAQRAPELPKILRTMRTFEKSKMLWLRNWMQVFQIKLSSYKNSNIEHRENAKYSDGLISKSYSEFLFGSSCLLDIHKSSLPCSPSNLESLSGTKVSVTAPVGGYYLTDISLKLREVYFVVQKFCCLRFLASMASRMGCLLAW